LSIKLDYYTKYYSGRSSTYRLDRTIVMSHPEISQFQDVNRKNN
jgi:hypothetical protein